jgi:glycogen debranching enzyme
MSEDIIHIEGKSFIAHEQVSLPEWPYVIEEGAFPTLTLKDDDLFLITDALGNISGGSEAEGRGSLGLFCRDTRFLSRLELQIGGRSPTLLSSDARKGFALSVLCTNPVINGLEDTRQRVSSDPQLVENRIFADTIGIQREIVLNGGLFEELTLTNYATHTIRFQVSLSFDADFMDLFEVRGYDRPTRGQKLYWMPLEEGDSARSMLRACKNPRQLGFCLEELNLAYQGLDGIVVESLIQFSDRQPDNCQGYTAIWNLELKSHETQQLAYRVQLLTNGRPTSSVFTPMTLKQAKAAEMIEEQDWLQCVTHIRTDNKAINQIIEQAEKDIYLLRQSFGKNKALSAGVPWFSTLFGRDALIAASQALVLDPTLAKATLAILAEYQGKTYEEWREEEPGKILHELRFGEMARCNEVPHTPYYGTIDATPLWLMLYTEYYAWTRDQDTIERLWPNALAAMDWIDRNCKATGYLAYHRRSSRGLTNQGWKDSGDCIVDHQGRLAHGSITLCEVQGYTYAAKVRMCEIAHLLQEADLAKRWQAEAEALKRRFNQDFWIADRDYCALALDGKGKRVDSITSNPGHCLGVGIFDLEKAQSVAERLLAPDMFNGWGIRTLSSLSPAYNPMGYHIGSVWPHDNAFIAQGLRSLGLVESALEVTQGIFDMTLQQVYQRPPELFCGHDRTDDNSPIRYPVACSPQAWATGTLFQLVRLMVNLVPDAPNNCLRIIDPALPPSIQHLSIHHLQIGNTLLDLEFTRTDTSDRGYIAACQVVRKRGNLRVVIEA